MAVKTVDEARIDLGLTEMEDTELGGTLVPLATKVQGAPVQGQPFMSMPTKAMQDRAVREDLRRWQSVELRRLAKGEQPGGYDFVSEYIPAIVTASIKAILVDASTDDEVKAVFAAVDFAEEVRAAFAAGFQETGHDHRRVDWSAYP